MPDSQFVVQCQALNWHRGLNHILKDVSFTIPQGSKVGLLGSNGSGKSSLLKCLTGLTLADSGTVELFGQSTMEMNDSVRERIAYVAQTPDLFPWLTVEQHLKAIGQAYPRWTERRALELALHLELSLGKLVSKLSGGDQQKLAIVLALAHEPDLIFMDEPVANLDPLRRAGLMQSLFVDGRWVKEEATIVFTSHLLADLNHLLTHILFMRQGELQWQTDWVYTKKHCRLIPKTEAAGLVSSPHFQSKKLALIDLNELTDAQGNELSRRFPAPTLDAVFAALND